jgi:hypothetical protein
VALTFPEVSHALRAALSSACVERRQKLADGAALSGAGKRAAFALFYGLLHHLLVTHIVHALPGATFDISSIVDLGCDTRASGAAAHGKRTESDARATIGTRHNGPEIAQSISGGTFDRSP